LLALLLLQHVLQPSWRIFDRIPGNHPIQNDFLKWAYQWCSFRVFQQRPLLGWLLNDCERICLAA